VLIRYLRSKIPYQHPISSQSTRLQDACDTVRGLVPRRCGGGALGRAPDLACPGLSPDTPYYPESSWSFGPSLRMKISIFEAKQRGIKTHHQAIRRDAQRLRTVTASGVNPCSRFTYYAAAGTCAPEEQWQVPVAVTGAGHADTLAVPSGPNPPEREGRDCREQQADGQVGLALLQRDAGEAAGERAASFCLSSSICFCNASGWGEAFLESSSSSMARARLPSFSSRRARLTAI
jgi:hypothetical protein